MAAPASYNHQNHKYLVQYQQKYIRRVSFIPNWVHFRFISCLHCVGIMHDLLLPVPPALCHSTFAHLLDVVIRLRVSIVLNCLPSLNNILKWYNIIHNVYVEYVYHNLKMLPNCSVYNNILHDLFPHLLLLLPLCMLCHKIHASIWVLEEFPFNHSEWDIE